MSLVSQAADTTAQNAERLAIALIAKYEGFRATPYVCPGGHITIGYGFSDPDLVAKKTMTRIEADIILGKKVRTELAWLNTKLRALSAKQQAACVSFIYNFGRTRFLESTLFKRLKSQDYLQAALEIKRWDKCNGQVLAGLSIRRAEEARYILS